MRFLSNSAKFSAGRPLLPGYNFSATMATTYSTYRLGAVASLKFLAIENMTPHFLAGALKSQVLETQVWKMSVQKDAFRNDGKRKYGKHKYELHTWHHTQ